MLKQSCPTSVFDFSDSQTSCLLFNPPVLKRIFQQSRALSLHQSLIGQKPTERGPTAACTFAPFLAGRYYLALERIFRDQEHAYGSMLLSLIVLPS